MAALVLMACNQNEPKVEKQDRKALLSASESLIGLVGQSTKDVKAAMKSAGFENVTSEMGSMPARLIKRDKASSSYLAFAINYPEVTPDSEASAKAFYKKIADSKNVFALIYFEFDEDDACQEINVNYVASQEVKNIHQLCLLVNDNLYNNLDVEEWQGMIAEDITVGEPDTYTDRAEFKKAFNALEVPFASEQALGGDGFGFLSYYYGDGTLVLEANIPIVLYEAEIGTAE